MSTHGRWAVLRLVLLIVSLEAALLGLLHGGFVERLSHFLDERRISIVRHQASGEVVVVAIDTASLGAFPSWPWPRRRHAALLDRLREAGVERLAIDIDFSAPSNLADDRALAEALARWGADRVALPVFHDTDLGADGNVLAVAPLQELAAHAALTAVNVAPGGDGRVRGMAGRQTIDGREFPAMPAWLVGSEHSGEIRADFAIAAETLPRVSYARVLDDPTVLASLRGRRILLGATAVSLGDTVAVPGTAAMPGVMVQALLAETLLQGRVQRVIALPALVAVVLLAAVVVLGRTVGVVSVLVLVGGGAVAIEVLALAGTSVGLAVSTGEVILSLLLGGIGAVLLRLGVIDRLRQGAALALRRERALMERVVEASGEAILTFEAGGRISTANPAAKRMFAGHGPVLPASDIGRLLDARVGSWWELAVAAGPPFETTGRRADGSSFAAEVALSAIVDGGEPIAVAVVRDVAERRAELAHIAYLAKHDQLTGLLNRAAFLEIIAGLIAGRGTLVVLRCHRLADLLETLGAAAVDALVGQLAGWLRQRLEGSVPVARVTDDSFAFFLARHSASRTAVLTRGLVADAPSRLRIGNDVAETEILAGLATAPDHADDALALLQRAQAAAGRVQPPYAVVRVYAAEQDRSARRRLTVVAALREAIASGASLSVAYQPKFRIRDRHCVGAEALVRWRHATLGAVSPEEFVPLAEEFGLIGGLTQRVLEIVIAEIRLAREQFSGGPIAVNLSGQDLADPELAIGLADQLARHGVEPSMVAFEVTESAMLADIDLSVRTLSALRQRGFKVAIDDFGTGQSSFGYLRDLPADELKLDRQFIRDALHDNAAATIVTAIVELGHKLGLGIVIEGVERDEQLAWLASIGADVAQGFLFGRPEPLDGCRPQLAVPSVPGLSPAAEPLRAFTLMAPELDHPRLQVT